MNENQAREIPCPICRAPSLYALTKEDHAYYRCVQCDFLFHRCDKKDAGESTVEFYDETYWEMERAEALRREREDSFMRAMELLYLSSIKVENILDFGCGLGMTVKLLRDKLGLNAIGIDISADFEKTEYLHRCDLGELQRTYPPGYFDAIYSVEVFEHLEDPNEILSLLHALLKPGGKILINTSTQEYMAKYDPGMTYVDPVRRGHISIYSLKSFSKLASSIGYGAGFLAERMYIVILSPSRGGDSFPHPENLERLRSLGEWFPGFLREYMRLVFVEEELETSNRWSVQLQGELKSLRAALVSLQEEFENKCRWNVELRQQLESLRAAHETLLERRLRRAARLLRSLWQRLL